MQFTGQYLAALRSVENGDDKVQGRRLFEFLINPSN